MLDTISGSPPEVAKLDGNLHLPSNSRFAISRLTAQASSEFGPPQRQTVFLDRDGVLIEDVHYLREPQQLCLLDGAAEGLRLLHRAYYLVVVTNQSGVARGFFSEATLLDIHTALVQSLWAQGAMVDAIYYCPHLPGATLAGYSLDCECRKPNPGMLLTASREWELDLARSFMVGDAARDLEAGSNAGVTGILIDQNVGDSSGTATTAPSLIDAAHLIIPIQDASE